MGTSAAGLSLTYFFSTSSQAQAKAVGVEAVENLDRPPVDPYSIVPAKGGMPDKIVLY